MQAIRVPVPRRLVDDTASLGFCIFAWHFAESPVRTGPCTEWTHYGLETSQFASSVVVKRMGFWMVDWDFEIDWARLGETRFDSV